MSRVQVPPDPPAVGHGSVISPYVACIEVGYVNHCRVKERPPGAIRAQHGSVVQLIEQQRNTSKAISVNGYVYLFGRAKV